MGADNAHTDHRVGEEKNIKQKGGKRRENRRAEKDGGEISGWGKKVKHLVNKTAGDGFNRTA